MSSVDRPELMTPEEMRSVRALARVASRWPRSITLASMGGALVVVHTNDDAFQDGEGPERSERVLAHITGVPNTGGDW